MNCAFDLYINVSNKFTRLRTYYSLKEYNRVNNMEFKDLDELKHSLPSNMSIVRLF